MTGPVAHLTSQESEWLALAERAVRGPWVVRPGRTYEPTVRVDPWDDGYPLELFQSGGLVDSQQANCEFVAAARTAVPELCRALEDERKAHERDNKWMAAQIVAALVLSPHMKDGALMEDVKQLVLSQLNNPMRKEDWVQQPVAGQGGE